MKLDDVLAMAGDHKLSGFPWGASAVLLVNSISAAQDHIDVDHSGKEAYEKLRRLPSATLLAVLTREVSVVGAYVEFVGHAGAPSTGIPATVPNGPRRMSPAAIILMVVMSGIAMMMTWSSMQATKAGQPPGDNQAVVEIIKTMTELLKDETQPLPAAPATPASP